MILHVDIDAFYPSLEEIRKPELAGKPIVVCILTRDGNSGAVASANYKARELGIRSGMPLSVAKSKANKDTVFIGADKDYYERKSKHIMEDLSTYGKIEQASIDEAYIEIEEEDKGTLIEIAKEIKQAIKKKFGLDVTVGVAPNKLLAKMASKVSKPRGLMLAKSIEDFSDYPVSLIPGIGSKTAEVLKSRGIVTIRELANSSPFKIKEWFPTKLGDFLVKAARGMGEMHVEEEKSRKQLGKIMTLPQDSDSMDEIKEAFPKLAKEVASKVDELGVSFSAVTLMLIDKAMEVTTRSKTIGPSRGEAIIVKTAEELLEREELPGVIRRVGIFVSKFGEEKQKTLMEF
ncbi:MAG: DNA polymerase IV [Bdellovibrio sp.]|nr:MAG: DNA polymerase IV [Bdellovibrio sp.]